MASPATLNEGVWGSTRYHPLKSCDHRISTPSRMRHRNTHVCHAESHSDDVDVTLNVVVILQASGTCWLDDRVDVRGSSFVSEESPGSLDKLPGNPWARPRP